MNDDDVRGWLARELATTEDDIRRLAIGHASADAQLQVFALPQRRNVQLYEDPWSALSIANDRAELFVLTTFPLIPPAHLHFLNLFYGPLLATELK
jgi:hypothetical protein